MLVGNLAASRFVSSFLLLFYIAIFFFVLLAARSLRLAFGVLERTVDDEQPMVLLGRTG